MTSHASLSLPNGLLFVSDVAGGDVPEFVPGEPILATGTVVAIGCLPPMDGETRVTLGPRSDVAPERAPAFSGAVATPSRKLVVSTVEEPNVIERDVPDVVTKLTIWTNRPVEPDEIVVGWG